VSKSQKKETLGRKIAALMKIHPVSQSPDTDPINKTIARFLWLKSILFMLERINKGKLGTYMV
jgi:hypothetical protein